MPELPGGWTVEVDRSACMGSGLCIVYAPATFAHDEEAKSVALEPPGDDLEAVRTAVDACPTGALTLLSPNGED